MPLLEETLGFLDRYKIRPRDRLDQNFIVDPAAVERHLGYADLKEGDAVLEVGPGTGTLTEGLLEAGARVIAVEKDPRLCRLLRDRFEGRDITILEGDILKIEPPEFDKCVSNIPYGISSPLTFWLLERGFELAVLTYQLEFARRMVAAPGTRDYSRISVACHYHARVEVLETLPPEAFYPRPEVSSAVVKIVPREPPFEVDEASYFSLVRGLFAHRKKTVRKALFHSLDRILSRPVDKGERRRLVERFDPGLLAKRVFQLEPREMAAMVERLYED
ncbi:MAG: ribosomal RNA small subunit methyltransferase A [Euryarchaeota archaeon]|nr:ribosomal RNA small subunit methyltransferase A [Euryarchaeota archaeon]